jgi:hypothetical protein
MPRRHADNHLRKQEERQHEAKQSDAHDLKPTSNVSPQLSGRSSRCPSRRRNSRVRIRLRHVHLQH